MKTRLKELRLQNHLLQKEIALFLRVSPSTYSYWEKGTYDIDSDNLVKLADYFEVSIDYLLGRDYVNKLASLSNDENKLIENYRRCSGKNKSLISWYAEEITKRE